MSSKIKVLGYLAAAILAVEAIGAGGAQADGEYTAHEYPAIIDATRVQTIDEPQDYFEKSGSSFTCEAWHFESELEEDSAHLTLSPTYTDHEDGGSCLYGGILRVTFTENNCVYTFETPEAMEEGEDYTISVEIQCPGEQQMEIHVRNLFNTANACTMTVPEQTLTGQFTAVNTEGYIDVSGEMSYHLVTHHFSSLCGHSEAPGTTEEEMTYVVAGSPLTLTSPETMIDIGAE